VWVTLSPPVPHGQRHSEKARGAGVGYGRRSRFYEREAEVAVVRGCWLAAPALVGRGGGVGRHDPASRIAEE